MLSLGDDITNSITDNAVSNNTIASTVSNNITDSTVTKVQWSGA